MTADPRSAARGRRVRRKHMPRPLLGRRSWVVPDGYLPSGEFDGFSSHEAVCLLNAGEVDARLELTVYLEDADPMTFVAGVPAQRTRHVRIEQLRDADDRSVPREKPFALIVRSDVPIVVQYSRMDVSSPRMALMTTMAFPADSGSDAGFRLSAAVRAAVRPRWRSPNRSG